jgi:hypothetical protein
VEEAAADWNHRIPLPATAAIAETIRTAKTGESTYTFPKKVVAAFLIEHEHEVPG